MTYKSYSEQLAEEKAKKAEEMAKLQAEADRWITSRMLIIQALGWFLFVLTGSFCSWDIMWIMTVGDWPGGCRFAIMLGWAFVTVVSYLVLREQTQKIIRGW